MTRRPGIQQALLYTSGLLVGLVVLSWLIAYLLAPHPGFFLRIPPKGGWYISALVPSAPAMATLQVGAPVDTIDGAPLDERGNPLWPVGDLSTQGFDVTLLGDGRLINQHLRPIVTSRVQTALVGGPGSLALGLWLLGMAFLWRGRGRWGWDARWGVIWWSFSILVAMRAGSHFIVGQGALLDRVLWPWLCVLFLLLAGRSRTLAPPAERVRVRVILALALLPAFLLLIDEGLRHFYSSSFFFLFGVDGEDLALALLIMSVAVSGLLLVPRQPRRSRVPAALAVTLAGVWLLLAQLSGTTSVSAATPPLLALALVPLAQVRLLAYTEGRSSPRLIGDAAGWPLLVVGAMGLLLGIPGASNWVPALMEHRFLLYHSLAIPLLGLLFGAEAKMRPLLMHLVYGKQAEQLEATRELARSLADTLDAALFGPLLIEQLCSILEVESAVLLVKQGEQLVPQGCTDEEISAVLLMEEADVCFLREQRRALKAEELAAHAPIWAAQYPWARLWVPMIVEERLVGVLLLGERAHSHGYTLQERALIELLATEAALALEATRLVTALRESARHAMGQRHAERALLSRQLHDEPLQELAILLDRLGEIKRKLAVSDMQFQQELQESQQLLHHTMKRLRDICAGLRPPLLDVGFPLALHSLVQQVQCGSDALLVHEIPENLPPLESVLPLALYHLASEALRNAARHSQASLIGLRLEVVNEQWLRLEVRDNGVGFHNQSYSELMFNHHFGLVGLHEWAAMIGATLEVRATPGAGTQVIVQTPLHAGHELSEPGS